MFATLLALVLIAYDDYGWPNGSSGMSARDFIDMSLLHEYDKWPGFYQHNIDMQQKFYSRYILTFKQNLREGDSKILLGPVWVK